MAESIFDVIDAEENEFQQQYRQAEELVAGAVEAGLFERETVSSIRNKFIDEHPDVGPIAIKFAVDDVIKGGI